MPSVERSVMANTRAQGPASITGCVIRSCVYCGSLWAGNFVVWVLKDVRAKNFYNTDFFHTLATVR